MNTSELILQPGETRTLTWIPKTPGRLPFYCTDFCSALHQEMQGYVRVSPAGSHGQADGERQPEDAGPVAHGSSEGRAVSDVDALETGSSRSRRRSLLAALAMPLWRIQLFAPQYPEGLGMEIRAGTVRGATEHDLRSINSLNHYIGMQAIEPEEIAELRVIPWLIAGLAVAGFVAAAIGRAAVPIDRGSRCSASSARSDCGTSIAGNTSTDTTSISSTRSSRCRDDLPAAADRHEATVELHGELVAGDRERGDRPPRSRSASRR